jgi:uncharacterized protein YbcI
MNRTKGELEAEVTKAVIKFQREQQGRGPVDVRAHVHGDLILVRLIGIFTPNETHLAVTEEGRRLIRSARLELRAINHAEIEEILAGLVGIPILRSYYDIDIEAAEQVEVYIFGANLDKNLAVMR